MQLTERYQKELQLLDQMDRARPDEFRDKDLPGDWDEYNRLKKELEIIRDRN